MTEAFDWVQHDGLSFRCRRDGPGGDEPWIVFSNSLATDLTVWDAQVEVLKDRFNILRYDQRGHGKTSVPDGPCSMDDLGADALALMDHFGIASCTFVGLSMGVPTGLYVLRHQPHRIERLVITDGQSATAATGAATWQSRIDSARADGMDEVARDTSERWFGEEFRAAGGADKARAVMAAVPLEGYVACATALQSYDFNDVLPAISIPTLLLVGANDGKMPDSMAVLAEKIPNSKFVVIPDAGHIPCYDQPDVYNRHLLDFLR